MTFFPGGGPGGGFGPRAQGVSGGGFWYPKIDQFLIKTKILAYFRPKTH